MPRNQGLHNPPPPPEREQGLDASQQLGAGLTAWGPVFPKRKKAPSGCAHSPMEPILHPGTLSEGCSLGRTSLTLPCCRLELSVPIYPVGSTMALCPSSRKPSVSFSSARPLQRPEKRPRQFQPSLPMAPEEPFSGGSPNSSGP